MSKTAFDKIADGLNDAIAFANGDEARGREATVDVRSIRAANNMTQKEFSAAYQLPIGTLRDWEQHRRAPDAPARALLKIIARDPKMARDLLADKG